MPGPGDLTIDDNDLDGGAVSINVVTNGLPLSNIKMRRNYFGRNQRLLAGRSWRVHPTASRTSPDRSGPIPANPSKFPRLDPIRPRHGGVSSWGGTMSERAKDFLERLAFTVAFVVVGPAIRTLTGINGSWAIPSLPGCQIIKTFSPTGWRSEYRGIPPTPRHCPCHRRNSPAAPADAPAVDSDDPEDYS